MSGIAGPACRRAIAVVVVLAVVVPVLTSCSGPAAGEVPECGEVERVALIAQSVPSTSYVPCISALQPGWGSSGLQAKDGGTRFTLSSDRSPNHPVHVELSRSCPIGTATPIAPRTPGGRSYLSLSSIDPRYTGTMYDVFPGGCVSYRFDFERGAHVPLMAQLQSIVGFVPRQQLRLDVQRQLGVRLDP
jgi:hypothetical protein